MKFKLFTLLLILISAQTFSQNKTATINGVVKNKIFTYAYLYDDDSKEAKVSKIENEQFKFEIENQKKLKLYRFFLGSEASILPENQVRHRIQDPAGYRLVALSDMNITVLDGVNTALIEGGELNKALDEMQKGLESTNFDNYFEKYPDSPISVYLMRILVQASKHTMIGHLVKVDSYYIKLSDRIKNSDEGKLIYASIYN